MSKWYVGFSDGSGAEEEGAHIVERTKPHETVIVRGGSPEEDICYGVLRPEHARLIAAAPTMHGYIKKRSLAGDLEARTILEQIDANS